MSPAKLGKEKVGLAFVLMFCAIPSLLFGYSSFHDGLGNQMTVVHTFQIHYIKEGDHCFSAKDCHVIILMPQGYFRDELSNNILEAHLPALWRPEPQGARKNTQVLIVIDVYESTSCEVLERAITVLRKAANPCVTTHVYVCCPQNLAYLLPKQKKL